MPLFIFLTIFLSFFLTACGGSEVNSISSDDISLKNTSPPKYTEKIAIDSKIPKGSVISPQYENLDFWGEEIIQINSSEFEELSPYVPPSNQESSTNYFRGSPCTSDCSGHSAGYRWAEENSISDEYECSNRSASFEEGCIEYVNEDK